jgi:hypothetical protein
MTPKEEHKQETEFFQLVQRLNTWDEPARAAADAKLQSLPTERLSALWEMYRRRIKTANSLAFLSIASLSVIILLTLMLWGNAYVGLLGILFPVVLLAIAGIHTPTRKAAAWKGAVKRLTRSDDVRVIEPLTDILAQTGVPQALTRLLPRLQPSDAAWFSQKSRNRLRSAIFSPYFQSHSELTDAFLRGMTAIGDRDTLVNIALLIIRDAPTAQEQHVREVARECLPRLQANTFGDHIEEIPALIETLPAVPAITTGIVSQKQYIAFFGLAHLLPQLTPADSHLLTSELRKRLCNNLGGLNLKEDFVTLSRLGPDYSLAVIGALERFGRAESLHTLERCAEGHFSPWQLSLQDEKRVRDAAAHALPIVEARVTAERESETLLRGSQAPEPSGDTLLRPAASAPETEPQQLLRASDTPST